MGGVASNAYYNWFPSEFLKPFQQFLASTEIGEYHHTAVKEFYLTETVMTMTLFSHKQHHNFQGDPVYRASMAKQFDIVLHHNKLCC